MNAPQLGESTSVRQACRLMASKGRDALLVVNAHGELTGIVTDNDICTKA